MPYSKNPHLPTVRALAVRLVRERSWPIRMTHRHSRVRQANDNAHVERFNRTVQEECFYHLPQELALYRALQRYLPYYNTERLHLGLNLKTPAQVV